LPFLLFAITKLGNFKELLCFQKVWTVMILNIKNHIFMKTNREEKLESMLNKLQEEIQVIRKELHTFKQKNRDMEKSRESYKEKVKIQAISIYQLNDELKKKLR
jgi:peptidoglycan hydrolase CwlO-like protein